MIDIRLIRKDRLGLSQGELGQLLGVTQGTVSKLETGELEIDERTALAIEALVQRKLAGQPLDAPVAA